MHLTHSPLVMAFAGMAISLAPAAIARAQTPARTESSASAGLTMAQADAFFQAGQFAEARLAYEQILARDPENALAMVRFGRAQLECGSVDEAIATERRAAGIPGVRSRAYFHLACAQAVKGDDVAALDAIDQGVAAGLSNAGALENEPKLAKLRSSPRFAEALARIAKAGDKPEYHEMDFWIGEWDVYSAAGVQVGENRIESRDKGCVLLENWKGAGGNTGTSINCYVPGTQVWRQQWMGSEGTSLSIEGRFTLGAMRLRGHASGRTGPATDDAMILTPLPNGRVRQTFFTSTDAGKTWTGGFDAVYVPKGQHFDKGEFPGQPVTPPN